MNVPICPIIQVAELLALYKSENLVIVDASNGKNAKSNYDEKHLDGAIFVDLNTRLADIKENLAIGGRHPLPEVEIFANMLFNIGISPQSHVVIYDDQNGANAAARFWWMLQAIGHEKVQVLNGGFQEAEKANLPMTSEQTIVHQAKTRYKVANWKRPTADMNEVENAAQDPNCLVIDVRSIARYKGETEPIDLIAGHIPGAINIPFTENLDKNGLFLSPSELKTKYESIFRLTKPENIIFHCGSGVTACHSLLAIEYANLAISKLYVGSWSEWSRNNKAIGLG